MFACLLLLTRCRCTIRALMCIITRLFLQVVGIEYWAHSKLSNRFPFAIPGHDLHCEQRCFLALAVYLHVANLKGVAIQTTLTRWSGRRPKMLVPA